MKKWYTLQYETLQWESKIDAQYVSRGQRSKILSTYQSSVPDRIADKTIVLPQELDARMSDLLVNLSRFDTLQSQKGYAFPLLLLRSESAASSQIENLTSSVKNISMAQLSDKAPKNARMIAGNVNAMKSAIQEQGKLSADIIKEIHFHLMKDTEAGIAGKIRDQAVWIGGTGYSPHGAIFVPPHHFRISDLLTDLIEFSNRLDMNPLVKAALLHAQFETIHPFVDGNGRVGRTLIHKSLKDDGVLRSVSLPVSAGLLRDIEAYMDAIKRFQEGDPFAIIEETVKAIETALLIGDAVSSKISEIISGWENRIVERKTSSIYRLIYLVAEQPVVNSMYIAEQLHITVRAANKLIDRAIGYGILSKFGAAQRGIFYEAGEIIDVLDMVSSNEIIRRMR